MERDYRFDIARVICMTFIVAFLHLYGYIYNEISANVIPWCLTLCDSCLGLFTFTSGYLLGKKYNFETEWSEFKNFYINRVVRIIPLFLLASLALWLIGFNSGKATLYGVLCLSPILNPAPMTLWYIPVIIWCYLFTPLVCRRGLKWRISVSALIMIAVIAIGKVKTIDYRFIYNLMFYLFGLVTSRYMSQGTWCVQNWAKLLLVIVFAIALIFSNSLSFIPRLAVSSIGVLAVLFLCEALAGLIFSEEANRLTIVHILKNLVKYVSYASMAVYMFHRLFFWAGEIIWNPSNATFKWLYMAGLVFPIMIALSYYIQYGYDQVVKKLTSSNKKV